MRALLSHKNKWVNFGTPSVLHCSITQSLSYVVSLDYYAGKLVPTPCNWAPDLYYLGAQERMSLLWNCILISCNPQNIHPASHHKKPHQCPWFSSLRWFIQRWRHCWFILANVFLQHSVPLISGVRFVWEKKKNTRGKEELNLGDRTFSLLLLEGQECSAQAWIWKCKGIFLENLTGFIFAHCFVLCSFSRCKSSLLLGSASQWS